MAESFEHPVYSINVIEFVTVAREFCNWLEHSEEQPRREFISTALKILPLLYLKANMLPETSTVLDEYLEKYVTEEEYEHVRQSVRDRMGRFDDYLEVFTADMQRSDLPLTSTVSENLADIYQDLMDFMMNYRSAVTEIMNDALTALMQDFREHWGQRLVNVLRALHMVYYGEDNLEDEEGEVGADPSIDDINTQDWIISRMQRDFRDGSL